MRPPAAVLLACTAVVALSTSCSGDGGSEASLGRTSPPASSSAPPPQGPADVCDAVSDERASELYGRPVSVVGGASCSFEEADVFDQDINVLWSVEEDTRVSFAGARRGLGVRSDDAERVLLAGGIPAWQVAASEGHAVIISTVVDGDLLSVTAMLTLLHEPFRTIPELLVIARGIAESYTA